MRWRMQAHASAAVVNFSEGADQDILPPYLDTLITKLLVRATRVWGPARCTDGGGGTTRGERRRRGRASLAPEAGGRLICGSLTETHARRVSS